MRFDNALHFLTFGAFRKKNGITPREGYKPVKGFYDSPFGGRDDLGFFVPKRIIYKPKDCVMTFYGDARQYIGRISFSDEISGMEGVRTIVMHVDEFLTLKPDQVTVINNERTYYY
jgi:hypothetical protein